jgi:glutamyl-tRNA synthetase
VMLGEAKPLLEEALSALAGLDEWNTGALEECLGGIVEAHGVKPRQLYQPIRVAITGTTISPGIFESLAALGRADSLERLESAIARMD